MIKGKTVKEVCEDLGFDSSVEEDINEASKIFDRLAKEKGDTLIQWLIETVEECKDEKFFVNLTTRETFLYSLGAMCQALKMVSDKQ